MSRFPRERINLNCTVCNTGYEIVKSRLGKAKYCSNKCRTNDTRKVDVIHNCANCGEGIQELANHRDQMKRNGADKFFCNRGCYNGFYLKKLPIGSKRKCPNTNYIWLKIKHDYWRVEHRVIAEDKIGRDLNYDSEPILHIDGDHSNNKESNLYICADKEEIMIILKSYSAPYPSVSNLETYR